MRRIVVVVGLLIMMAGLDALKLEAQGDASPLTLAAIGFVLLASFALSELGARFSLPRVTGYVVGGLVLGPSIAGIMPTSVVDELQIFRTLALGLVALIVGLGLDLRALVERRLTLGATLGVELVTSTVFVGGALVAFEHATGTLGLSSDADVWILGAVLGVLALASSPALVAAVAVDARAKGPMTELALSTAALKEIVAPLALMLLLMVEAFFGRDAGEGSTATPLLEGLGASLLAGALLGGLLISLLPIVRSQILLLTGAIVLFVAELSTHLALAPLMTFMVAGMTVRTFSPREEILREGMRKIALPLFIVFFTSLGSSLDLHTLGAMLPLALVLGLARALSAWAATRVGTSLGEENDEIRRLAWLGHLPQAEVTLGLLLIAAGALPQFSPHIMVIGTAMAAVHAWIGPIGLQYALRRVAETGPQRHASPTCSEEVLSGAVVAHERAMQSRFQSVSLESPQLRRLAAKTRRNLDRDWQAWQDDVLVPAVRRWTELLRIPPSSDRHIAAEVMERLDRVPAYEAQQRLEQIRTILASHLAALEALPSSETVPLERHLAEASSSDSPYQRLYKRLTGLVSSLAGRSGRRTRAVPVRLIARTSIEPRMCRAAEETLRDWQRFEVLALEALQRAVLGTASGPEVNRDLESATESFIVKVRANIEAAIEAGLREFSGFAARAGAPGESAHAYRYSRVEREIHGALQRIEEDALTWGTCRMGAVSTLRFIARVEHAQHQLVQDIIRDIAAPLDEAFAAARRIVEEERQRIESLPSVESVVADEEEWERLALRAHAILPKPVLKELRTVDNRIRRATSTSAPMTGLLNYLDDRAEKIRMAPSLHELVIADRPATVAPVAVDVRQLKEIQIAGQLLPGLERSLADVGDAFTQIRETVKEAANLIDQGFESTHRARGTQDAEGLAKLAEAITQASTLLQTLEERACAAWSTERGQILSSVARMSNRMIEAVNEAVGGTMRGGTQSGTGERLWARARHLLDAALQRWRWLARGLHLAEAGQAAEDLAHLYRLRAGLHRLDAQAIRALIAEQEKLRQTPTSDTYATLFSPDPLRDPRLFVANADVLEAVLTAERAWQAKSEQGNSVLVVGPSGSGKSSMLGVARLRVSSRRVMVVRPAVEGDASVFAAVAHALGTEASTEALTRILQSQRSIVILDDLHAWFSPTPAGVDELEAFLALIAATQASTFWIASMPIEAFEVWSETVPLEHAFASIPRLRPLKGQDMEAVVSARHHLSGMALSFPSTFGTKLAQKLLRRSARASFLRHITAASHGNLRRAMELWRVHARVAGDVVAMQRLHTLAWGFAFLRPLSPQLKAILAALVCHGALDISTLSRCVGADEREMRQALRFLVASGLVHRLEACGRFAVRSVVKDDLIHALAEDGVIAGGRT